MPTPGPLKFNRRPQVFIRSYTVTDNGEIRMWAPLSLAIIFAKGYVID